MSMLILEKNKQINAAFPYSVWPPRSSGRGPLSRRWMGPLSRRWKEACEGKACAVGLFDWNPHLFSIYHTYSSDLFPSYFDYLCTLSPYFLKITCKRFDCDDWKRWAPGPGRWASFPPDPLMLMCAQWITSTQLNHLGGRHDIKKHNTTFVSVPGSQ